MRVLARVSLDGSRIADARVVGVEPRRSSRPALMEQIPALVQGDAELAEALSFGVGDLAAPLSFPELVLLVRDLVDPRDRLLVVHAASSPSGSVVKPRQAQ